MRLYTCSITCAMSKSVRKCMQKRNQYTSLPCVHLQAMKEAETGIYCGPLRLLAMEVFDSVNQEVCHPPHCLTAVVCPAPKRFAMVNVTLV